MSLSRRTLVIGGPLVLASGRGGAGTGRGTGTGTAAAPAAGRMRRLPAPALDDDRVVRCVAGVRPYRTGGIRIEREQRAGKILIHNYGHGGAGITLAWGSAEEVAGELPPGVRGPVAVAGAGAIGLTSALVLAERKLAVRIYARDLPPHTTSDLAGAEWSPDFVDRGATPADLARFHRLALRSWRRFLALDGKRWGIRRRLSVQADGVHSALDDLPPGLGPRAEPPAPFLFGSAAHAGKAYRTLLIEPPRFLPALVEALRARGVSFTSRSFAGMADLLGLPEPVIVNCLGLGAGEVVGDGALVPIKGQLVHLRPQRLPYLLNHPAGYLFARSDALVLGGSFERGRSDTAVDPAVCTAILDANRAFFA
jgi:glycine/D-amino acid oxidase-like deaminating enzyme